MSALNLFFEVGLLVGGSGHGSGAIDANDRLETEREQMHGSVLGQHRSEMIAATAISLDDERAVFPSRLPQ